MVTVITNWILRVDMHGLYRNVCRIDVLFDSVQFDLQDCDKIVA